MAEIKNSFLKSKMNKDLDDRLIPNGEYRDAQNISVGKSESDDIGALETVLGNTVKVDFSTDAGLASGTLKVIGYYSIDIKNSIIVFLTDYNDTAIDPVLAPLTANCYIYQYNSQTNAPTKLVSGSFLNFSESSPITGISVIEDLLFWTDNRNQPRKINIDLAANNLNYYTTENQISVAKYNPYEPINVLNKVKTTTTTSGASTTITVASATGIYKGMSVVQYGNTALEAKDYVYVTNVSGTTITINASTTIVAGDIYFLSTTMTGENITYDFNSGSASTWPGDPDYLEDKFVRFSYRFEFDDGEYSLMAPFTQIAFIPKQKGYFLGDGEATAKPADENDSYRSTVVQFMENGVQNVELHIPFPDICSKVQPTQSASYKIKSLQILYKESDARAVKILDIIEPTEWTGNTSDNIFTYQYQSRKPFRTLPENQTIRVYDKVPVKALSQETAGNRIIYGNFKDKYSPPTTLEYLVGVGDKSIQENFDNWSEYPTHSLKQNRNYQVGFVLIDKFGRQSDVVLSSVKLTNTTVGSIPYGGDTVYHKYNTQANQGVIRDWFGDSLKINITSPIVSGVNNSQPQTSTGQPGLYARQQGNGYNSYQALLVDQPTITTSAPFYYEFELGATYTDIPVLNTYLEGEHTDYVKVTQVQPNTPTANRYRVTTDGQVSSTYLQQSSTNPDVKYSYLINPIGWYSYKIVVKQQEQDYYNVYLPGILKGYPAQITSAVAGPPAIAIPPSFPDDPSGSTSNIVLINDNINKVPRDLNEVGPEQRQFRSSVRLFGRVENKVASNDVDQNQQFYPGILSDTVISIATADDSNMEYETLSANPALPADPTSGGVTNLYQLDSNPLIARIDTTAAIGLPTATMKPFLAIYETEPQESLLDIFWETSTVGLISELNDAILSDFDGAVGWSSYNSNNFTEASTGNFITGLSPVDSAASNLINTELTQFAVTDEAGNTVTSNFNFTRSGAGTGGDPHLYSFGKANDDFVFNYTSNIRKYEITGIITNLASGTVSSPLSINIELQNVQPTINTNNTLPAITGINDAFTGTLATITGENGAVNSTLKLQNLKWSISGGNANNYFSIDASTGVLSKVVSGAQTAGTHNLNIKLEDAYNGVDLATGSLNRIVVQQVVVNSSVIGNVFTASQPGVFNQSCNFNGALNATCGTVTYYNQTSGTPTVNDIIRTGPNGASSSLALAGYYSYDCGSTGNGNRKYFVIAGNDGKITVVSTC
jgi:hypothetical protein